VVARRTYSHHHSDRTVDALIKTPDSIGNIDPKSRADSGVAFLRPSFKAGEYEAAGSVTSPDLRPLSYLTFAAS